MKKEVRRALREYKAELVRRGMPVEEARAKAKAELDRGMLVFRKPTLENFKKLGVDYLERATEEFHQTGRLLGHAVNGFDNGDVEEFLAENFGEVMEFLAN